MFCGGETFLTSLVSLSVTRRLTLAELAVKQFLWCLVISWRRLKQAETFGVYFERRQLGVSGEAGTGD